MAIKYPAIRYVDSVTGELYIWNGSSYVIDTINRKVAGINPQSGTYYDLVLSDAGKYIRCTNANSITVGVPLNADVPFEIGTVITIVQSGDGVVTVVGWIDAPDEVTLNALEGLKTNGKFATMQLIKIATDEWDVIGGVA